MSKKIIENMDEFRRLAGVTEATPTPRPDSFKVIIYRHEDGTWDWSLDGYYEKDGENKRLKASGKSKSRNGAFADIRSYMDRMRPETPGKSSEELDLDQLQTELEEAFTAEDLNDKIKALGEKMKIAFAMIREKLPQREEPSGKKIQQEDFDGWVPPEGLPGGMVAPIQRLLGVIRQVGHSPTGWMELVNRKGIWYIVRPEFDGDPNDDFALAYDHGEWVLRWADRHRADTNLSTPYLNRVIDGWFSGF